MNRRNFIRNAAIGSAPLFVPGLIAARPAPDKKAYLRLIDKVIGQGPFQDTWSSLSDYTPPGWYEDAKLGIFIHWGVYSVPAFKSEWYPREMYLRKRFDFLHHRRKWGPQDKFGYKDFIPMFKAEKFDPDRWMEMFKQAGAKYVVPVAEHHDGFAMYDCGFSDWTAVKMGPCRDVVGELREAAHRQGIVFGASTHRAEHWWFFEGGRKFNSDVNDPRYESFYGPAQPRNSQPDRAFLDDWLVRTAELIDLYRPRILWFDWWIEEPAFEPYRKKIAAYYYNRAAEWGEEVVLNYKHQAFPDGAAILDLERSALADIRPLVWQTDTTISLLSWGYIDPDTEIYKDAGRLVEDLVDIISKNGVLLLNVGPAPDGTFPDEVVNSLQGIGRWLETNGEGVYGSRPWKVYGEGPIKRGRNTIFTVGEFLSLDLTSRDIRFTQKGDKLYAFVMGWPRNRRVSIKSLGRKSSLAEGEVSSVRLLGHDGPKLEFDRHDRALSIVLPPKKPCEHVFTLEIQGLL